MSRAAHPESGPASLPASQRLVLRAKELRERPNPIFLRELRQSARLGRTPVLILLAVLGMTFLVGTTGGVSSFSSGPAKTGALLFQLYFSLAYFLVMLCGPAMAANSLASEHEGRTWEALRLTGISPGEIARGKFLAAFTNLALYVVALAPVGAVAFLFGGVTPLEIVGAYAFLALVALIAVAFGLTLAARLGSGKGSLALTILLSLPFSLVTFLFFGLGLSYAAHEAWPMVERGAPIWLPVALARAPVTPQYFAFLIMLPIVLFALPAWFFYEATISALTSYTDDRSYRLKVWFVVTSLVTFLTGCVAMAAMPADSKADAALGAVVLVTMLGTFGVFVFAGDPVGPSRRVVIQWDRGKAGRLRRFLGPGVMRSAGLLVGVPLATLLLLGGAAVGMAAIAKAPNLADQAKRVAVFVFHVTGFWVFVTGFAAFVRARTRTALAPRLLVFGLLGLLTLVPIFLYAFASAVTAIPRAGAASSAVTTSVALLGAPSPFFAFALQDEITKPNPWPMLTAAVVAFAAYALLGLVLLLLARSKANSVIAAHEATLADAQKKLAEEDQRAATGPGA